MVNVIRSLEVIAEKCISCGEDYATHVLNIVLFLDVSPC
jgi:hypothetical protein